MNFFGLVGGFEVDLVKGIEINWEVDGEFMCFVVMLYVEDDDFG